MKKKIIASLFSILLSTVAFAEKYDMPLSIKRIIEEIGTAVPASGEFYCNSLPGKPLLYVVPFQGTPVQIGVRLFSDKIRDNIDSVICDCVERVWLELLLCKDIAKQKKLLEIKRIALAVNGMPLGSKNFMSLSVPLEIMMTAENFSLKSSSDGINLRFTAKDESCLNIFIPSDPSVIFAFDKKEHEQYLFLKLSASEDVFRPKRLGYPTNFSEDGDFLVSGGRHYLIDSLNNNIYFHRQGKTHRIVYDSSHPVTTLRNLGMGALPADKMAGIILDIHQKTYGNGHNDSLVPFSKFLGYMQQEGVDFYSGELSGNTALFLFHHPVFQYIHMLKVTIPDSSGFPYDCTVNAELMAFIPQNYISNYFKLFL